MGEKDLYAYLFIQKRLLDCSDEENKIDYKEAISHIIISRFPKVLFSKFIKEMIDMKLIEIIKGRGSQKIIHVINIDECQKIDNDTPNRVYRLK